MRNKKVIALISVVVSLVIVVVACCATFLVRDVRAYSYYGNSADGTDYDSMVIEAAAIKKNSSIFFLDENAVKTRVENAYSNIGVVNVERIFPDKVSINYVVYENSFQYANGGRYYQCYSSGRISGSSQYKQNGYITVKPSEATSTVTGAFFQSSDGADRKTVEAFIKFMYTKGLSDKQIDERIDFIDLTREGYIYIRTTAGCSMELHGSLSEFNRLMEHGWNMFIDPNPASPVTSRVSGLIQVYMYRGGDEPDIRGTYIKAGGAFGTNTDGTTKYFSDEVYYAENYSHNA